MVLFFIVSEKIECQNEALPKATLFDEARTLKREAQIVPLRPVQRIGLKILYEERVSVS